jgi:hypothetical protein
VAACFPSCAHSDVPVAQSPGCRSASAIATSAPELGSPRIPCSASAVSLASCTLRSSPATSPAGWLPSDAACAQARARARPCVSSCLCFGFVRVGVGLCACLCLCRCVLVPARLHVHGCACVRASMRTQLARAPRALTFRGWGSPTAVVRYNGMNMGKYHKVRLGHCHARAPPCCQLSPMLRCARALSRLWSSPMFACALRRAQAPARCRVQ